MDAADKLLEVVRKTVTQLFPELAGRYHLFANAKVLKTGDGLHLQMITREGAADEKTPPVKCEPVPYTLKAGNTVRMCFLYGDPSEPWPVPVSTAAIGTMTGNQVTIEGYGTKPAIVAEHLLAHFLLGTVTTEVDEDGKDLPGATTTKLSRFDFLKRIKNGDKVAVLPIEEGERFIVVAKLLGV